MNKFKEMAMECRGFIGLEDVKKCLASEVLRDGMYRLASTVKNMPKIYEQDGMGDEAVAHIHYVLNSPIHGKSHWYITEREPGSSQIQAFGLVSLYNGYPELGYIDISNIMSVRGVSIDYDFQPTTLGELKSAMPS